MLNTEIMICLMQQIIILFKLNFRVLKENPETHTNILVDEFQDTDPVQAEIFEILL